MSFFGTTRLERFKKKEEAVTTTSSNTLNQQQIQKEVLEEEDLGYVWPPKKGYQQQQPVVQQQVQEEEYRAYDWPLNITNKQRLNDDPPKVVTTANQTTRLERFRKKEEAVTATSSNTLNQQQVQEAEKEKNEIMRSWPKSQIPNSFNDKNFTEPLNPSIVRSDILRDDEESYSFSSPGKKKNVKFDLSEDSDGEFAVASDEEEISVASSESEGRKEDEFSTESFDDLNDSTQEFLANESDDSSLVKRKFRNPENFENTDEFQKYLDKKLAIPQRSLVSLRDFDDSADSDDSIFIKKKLAIPQWKDGRPDRFISKIQDELDESDDHVYEPTGQKKRADDPPKKSFCSAKKLLIEEQKDKDGNDNTSKKSLALADEGISIDIDMTCEKVETNINNLTEFLESSTVRYQEEQLDVINCIKELVEHDALVIMVPNLLEAVSQNRLLSEKIEKFK